MYNNEYEIQTLRQQLSIASNHESQMLAEVIRLRGIVTQLSAENDALKNNSLNREMISSQMSHILSDIEYVETHGSHEMQNIVSGKDVELLVIYLQMFLNINLPAGSDQTTGRQ